MTRGYVHRVDVTAAPDRVWRALTASQELRVWCSPGAAITARAGGLFRASVDRVVELEAHIDVFEPQRRLRLIYLPSPELPPAETAVVDDFLLDASRTGATLRQLGSGIPREAAWDTQYRRLRAGWQHALLRLKVFVEKHPDGEGPAT